jgi:chromosome segregation ATPase
MKQIRNTLLAIALAAFAAGCATKGYQKADQTGAYLQTAAETVNKGIAQIDTATGALKALVENPQADMQAQFKTFSAAVANLESLTKDVGTRAAKIQQLGTNYLRTWSTNLATIQNEDIRKQSAERKDEVMKKFEAMKTSYGDAREAFRPLLADLKDIRTALSTDLTAAGVEAIRKSMTGVNKRAEDVRNSLAELSTQFKEFGKSLEVPLPPPAPKAEAAPAAK